METVCRQASREISAHPERELSAEEIPLLATELLSREVASEDKRDFLRALAQRGETASELAGFANAFMHGREFELNGTITREGKDVPLLDVCGTGGGHLPLLNVSTGIMFVLGAMGVPVVKHGNRAVTKSSGSADVLEALGINIHLQPGQWKQCLEQVGVTFIFAPGYYASFAEIAPVRKALAAEGQRTIFNLLGPLLNPAQPESRLVGVFSDAYLKLYGRSLEQFGSTRYSIVSGYELGSARPIGEVGVHWKTEVYTNVLRKADGSLVNQWGAIFPPKDIASSYVQIALVKNAEDSAARLENILQGKEKGYARYLLLVNAAVAAWTHGTVSSLEEGIARAEEAFDSGAAYAILQQWRRFSPREAENIKNL